MMASKIFDKAIGNQDSDIKIIWLHGWGQDHKCFLELAKYFKKFHNILIDFPGFGKSNTPSAALSVSDYANIINNYTDQKNEKIFLIGHSFGCRVAIKYCLNYGNKINGLVLISAAGLKRQRSILFKCKALLMKIAAKNLSKLDKLFNTNFKEKYSNKFGSRDYKSAKGIMKEIFVKTISEDLSNAALKIKNKTLIINGDQDQETPIEMAEQFNKLIKGSKLVKLKNFNHYNILSNGKFQLQNLILNFISSDI